MKVYFCLILHIMSMNASASNIRKLSGLKYLFDILSTSAKDIPDLYDKIEVFNPLYYKHESDFNNFRINFNCFFIQFNIFIEFNV